MKPVNPLLETKNMWVAESESMCRLVLIIKLACGGFTMDSPWLIVIQLIGYFTRLLASPPLQRIQACAHGIYHNVKLVLLNHPLLNNPLPQKQIPAIKNWVCPPN